MKCHAMSCSPCLRRCSAVPFLHIFPPSHPVPPPGCTQAAGPCFARIARAPARARGRAFRAGAVRAPDCARETADAPVPSAPAGAFLRPQPLSCAEKRERRPRKPPLSTPILPHFFSGQARAGNYYKIFMDKPLMQGGDTPASLPRRNRKGGPEAAFPPPPGSPQAAPCAMADAGTGAAPTARRRP